MGILDKNKKKSKKLNLLEMSEVERYKLIKAVRENLQQKIAEAKMWQSLLDTENLTINGEIVHREETQLTELSLKTEMLLRRL
jgi:Mg2+/Co2+ transporter CorB